MAARPKAARMAALILALLVALAVALPAVAQEEGTRFRAEVISVADGDTARVRALDDGKLHILCFKGVDTPETEKRGRRSEPGQAFGEEAKRFTVEHALKRVVEVESYGRDAYGRILAVLHLPEGDSVNSRLVRAGLAYAFAIPGETPPAERIAEEAVARAEKRGVWGAPWRVRPSLYRKYGSLKYVERDYRDVSEAMRPAPFPRLAVAPAEGPGKVAPADLMKRMARAKVRHLGVAAEYRDAAGARFHAVPFIDPAPKGFPFRVVELPAELAGAVGMTPPERSRIDAFLAARGEKGGAEEIRVAWVDPSAVEWTVLPKDEQLYELLVPVAAGR